MYFCIYCVLLGHSKNFTEQTGGVKVKTSTIHIDTKANHFKIALSSGSQRAQNIKRFSPPAREGKEKTWGEKKRNGREKTLRQLVKFKTAAGSRPGKLDRAESVSEKLIQFAPLSRAQRPLQQRSGAAQRIPGHNIMHFDPWQNPWMPLVPLLVTHSPPHCVASAIKGQTYFFIFIGRVSLSIFASRNSIRKSTLWQNSRVIASLAAQLDSMKINQIITEA